MIERGAFGQGIEAAKQGLPESLNPYRENETHYSQWEFGYELETVRAKSKQTFEGEANAA